MLHRFNMLRRYLSTQTAKTKVLFVEFGQPKSEFYAKQFLADAANIYYNVPDALSSLANVPWLVDKYVKKCVKEYGKAEPLEDTIGLFGKCVEESLTALVSEFGPIECSTAFLLTEDGLRNQLEDVLSSDISRLVLFPVFPHFHCSKTGVLLNVATQVFSEQTVSAIESPNIRIVPGSPRSFTVSAIHSWADHPVLTNFWYELLLSVQSEYDAILFVAPAWRGSSSSAYQQSIYAASSRLMAELDFSVPYKIGFYNDWTQWKLPISNCYKTQGRRLAGNIVNRRRVAIVPITAFYPTFDTSTLLPDMAAQIPGSFVLAPLSSPASSRLLVTGVSELIKNHLLGRRNAQYSLLCPTCTSKEACNTSRKLLAAES